MNKKKDLFFYRHRTFIILGLIIIIVVLLLGLFSNLIKYYIQITGKAVYERSQASFSFPSSVPHQFYGTVTCSSGTLNSGVQVKAELYYNNSEHIINFYTTIDSNGNYGYTNLFLIDYGINGDKITFYVGTFSNGNQTFTSGETTRLNLVAGSDSCTVSSIGSPGGGGPGGGGGGSSGGGGGALTLQQCRDGIDNDGDGLIDYLNDPDCIDRLDNDESNPLVAQQVEEIQEPAPVPFFDWFTIVTTILIIISYYLIRKRVKYNV